MLPQPLVRVRLTVLATAPAAAAEARRTDWKRMVLYWRLEKRSRWRCLVELATAACVEVLYRRAGCLLELIYRALGQSVDPIGHHLSRHIHALAFRVDQVFEYMH